MGAERQQGVARQDAGHLLAPAHDEVGVVDRLRLRVGQASRLVHHLVGQGVSTHKRLGLPCLDRRGCIESGLLKLTSNDQHRACDDVF